ncbi:MAG: lipopolysaccharide biosynthesis protein [Syntrophobacteraceae bacterium]
MVGIWSLVIATTAIITLGNLGMTGSLVKYVAKYDALNDMQAMCLSVQTAVISGGVSSLLVMIIAYPVAKEYLNIVMKPELYAQSLQILPYALIGYWIALLTSIYQSVLYGCQLIIYQNIILVGDAIGYLICSYIIVPIYGLVGLVCCRVFVNCVTLSATLLFIRKRIPFLPILPRTWDRGAFKEMIRYALNFQAIIILGVFYDPVTKGLLSRFGSVSMVGYFEMANKVVQQVRSLFVNAYQVLVPAFANLKETEPGAIPSAYLNSYRLLFYMSLPVYSLCAIAMPLASFAWIGGYEPLFVWPAVILMGGWFFNTLGIPAYYACLGSGEMQWNVISYFVMSSANLLLGLLFAKIRGGSGVVTAWALSLFLGGMIQNISYKLKNHIALKELFPSSSRPLALCSLLGVVIGCAVCHEASAFCREPAANCLMICSFILTIIIPLWAHPSRKEFLLCVSMIVPKKIGTIMNVSNS